MAVLLAACQAPDGKDPVHEDPVGDDSGGDDTGLPDSPVFGFEALDATGAHNLIVVQVDTLRADRLPQYGGENDTMPISSRRPWMVVDGLRTVTSWTVPSTVSLLTGLRPRTHGITRMTADHTFNSDLHDPTAATTFGEAGYATMVISGNESLEQVVGMFDDFETVDPRETSGYTNRLGWEVEATLNWISDLPAETPFYVHLQPMNVHGPYEPLDEHLGTFSDVDTLPFDLEASEDEQLDQFRAAWIEADEYERDRMSRQLHALYDETILGVDAQLEELIMGLEQRGLAQDTIVVMVADHGETLLEEDARVDEPFFGHGGKARPELVTVPFLIHHPSFAMGDRVECVSENEDVLPTLLQALGLPAIAGEDGEPLQDGCRTIARSGVFVPDVEEDALSELAVSNATDFLRWDCLHGEIHRYDLTTDPTGLVSLPAEDFPADASLTLEMQSYLADIQEAFGELPCAVK